MGSHPDKKAGTSRTAELIVAREAVGDLFRSLADGLEGRELRLAGETLAVDGVVGLKVSVKDKGEAFAVKVKFKLAAAGASGE